MSREMRINREGAKDGAKGYLPHLFSSRLLRDLRAFAVLHLRFFLVVSLLRGEDEYQKC